MKGVNALFVPLAILAFSLAAFAQEEEAGPLSVSKIQFSGLVDAYYSKNFNNPFSRQTQGRAFDLDAQEFKLNMAKLEIQAAPEPVGFRIDLGFGRGFEIFNGLEPGGDSLQYVPQAYVSVAPENWGGVQLDFGKFYTSAGAEPTETHLNWNYSRSRIYTYGPYFHAGARATFPLNDQFSLGAQILNGWDSVRDRNTGKTIGFTSALTLEGFNWYNTYLGGPENNDTNKGFRNFYDTVISFGNDKAQAYVNFDWGRFKPLFDDGTIGRGEIVAVTTAARFQLNEWFAISPRYGWYNDKDGAATGQDQTLQDFTFTLEGKMRQGFISRLEYRRDWSDQPFFDRGFQTGNAKSVDTLTLGLVVFFGPGGFQLSN